MFPGTFLLLFLRYPDVSFLAILLHKNRTFTIGIIFIFLNNTSNKAQVSRSLKSQLFKKNGRGGRRQSAIQSAALTCVCRSKERVCYLSNSAFFMYVKIRYALTTFYSPDSICIESSSSVSWTRRPTLLIAVNSRVYYDSLCLKNTQRRRDFKGGVAFGVARNFCSDLALILIICRPSYLPRGKTS